MLCLGSYLRAPRFNQPRFGGTERIYVEIIGVREDELVRQEDSKKFW